jgi:outer membrane immunogenic protein
MRRFCLGSLSLVLSLLGTAGFAVAADLPAPPPIYTKAPILPPPFTWTGFYFGANAGGGWGYGSDSNSFFAPLATTTGNFNLTGPVAGGQVGYNWQAANWVFGIESDADWSNVIGKTSAGLCTGVVCTETNTWIGTTRGRIGYAADRWLPYVTGGVAYGSVNFVDSGGAVHGTTTRAGWTVGGGVEYGFTRNISAKVEYLYANLGSAGLPCAVPGGVVCGTSTQTFNVNIVRAGLNFRFF